MQCSTINPSRTHTIRHDWSSFSCTSASPSNSVSELQQASLLNVKVASGRTVKVLAQVNVKFNINEHQFDDVFLILP